MCSESKRIYKQIETDDNQKGKELQKLQLQKLELEKEIYIMHEQVEEMKRREEATADYRQKVHDLIRDGVLDENGDFIRYHDNQDAIN